MDANRNNLTYSVSRTPCLIQGHGPSHRSDVFDTFGELSSVEAYPAPFVIRNTFIECQVGRNPSFDEFYQERAARSCPSSNLSAIGVPADSERAKVTPVNSHVSGLNSADTLTKEGVFVAGRLFDGQLSFRNTFVHFPVDRPASLEAFTNDRHARSCPSSGVELHEGSEQDHALPREPVQPPVVLSLADSVPEPVLDVADFSNLPSVGSADHHLGTCSPCAFTIKGCSSGADCKYCHLCDPTEKKRRRKEKATILRGLRNLKQLDPLWILRA